MDKIKFNFDVFISYISRKNETYFEKMVDIVDGQLWVFNDERPQVMCLLWNLSIISNMVVYFRQVLCIEQPYAELLFGECGSCRVFRENIRPDLFNLVVDQRGIGRG